MIQLTKQERWVLILILAMLLTGWTVKAYRTAHPPSISPTLPAL
jgi:hypothetical protein